MSDTGDKGIVNEAAELGDSLTPLPQSLETKRISFHASLDPPVDIDGNELNPVGSIKRSISEKRRSSLFMMLEPLRKRLSTAQISRGLSWPLTAMFLVADLVGGGVVAMPVAFKNTGLPVGIVFMLVICTMFAISGWQLGQTWVVMQERWPIYKTHCRKPYPEIALRSLGYVWRIIAYVSVYFTLFGTTVVYIILPAKSIRNFIGSMGADLDVCILLVIIAICILPITYLKSPADFWYLIIFASLATVVAVILLLISTGIDRDICTRQVEYPKSTFLSALLSLGTFQFAFNGHHSFPTIQHDMHHPKQFTEAIIAAFICVAALYMPLSVLSYVVYGSSMFSSVIDSVQIPWVRYTADLAIALHCLLAVLITINPINQQIESIFKVPHAFGIKRVIVRTVDLAVVLFVAETVPDFTPIMNLFGSTTIPLCCITLPTLCNLWLKAARYDEDSKEWVRPTIKEVYQRSPMIKIVWTVGANILVLICAVIGCYMAISDFATVTFTPPCYVQPFLSTKYFSSVGSDINCCGKYHNILSHGNISTCFKPLRPVIWNSSYLSDEF